MRANPQPQLASSTKRLSLSITINLPFIYLLVFLYCHTLLVPCFFYSFRSRISRRTTPNFLFSPSATQTHYCNLCFSYYVARLLSVAHLLCMFTTFHDFLSSINHTGILVSVLERWLHASGPSKERQIFCCYIGSPMLHSLCCPLLHLFTYQPNILRTNRLQRFVLLVETLCPTTS